MFYDRSGARLSEKELVLDCVEHISGLKDSGDSFAHKCFDLPFLGQKHGAIMSFALQHGASNQNAQAPEELQEEVSAAKAGLFCFVPSKLTLVLGYLDCRERSRSSCRGSRT